MWFFFILCLKSSVFTALSPLSNLFLVNTFSTCLSWQCFLVTSPWQWMYTTLEDNIQKNVHCALFLELDSCFSPMTRVSVTFTCSVLWISGWYIADVNKRVFVNRQGHLNTAVHHLTIRKRFWFTANMGKYTELHKFYSKAKWSAVHDPG